MGTRWFKHFNDCIDNPKIQELIDEFGHTGYFVYFCILESYGREFSPKKLDSYRFKVGYLCHKSRIRVQLLTNIINFIKKVFDWEIEIENGYILVKINKFNELMDDYSKKCLRKVRTMSVQCPENVSLEEEVEEEVEEDKELKTSSFKRVVESKKFSEDSQEFLLAKRLWEITLKNSPKTKKPNLQNWAKEFSRILNTDKRDLADVEKILDELSENLGWFWVDQIRSPKALRGDTKNGADKFVSILESLAKFTITEAKKSEQGKLSGKYQNASLSSNLTGLNGYLEISEDVKKQIYSKLRESMSELLIKDWIEPCRIYTDENRIIITCINKYFKDYITAHFLEDLQRAFDEIYETKNKKLEVVLNDRF